MPYSVRTPRRSLITGHGEIKFQDKYSILQMECKSNEQHVNRCHRISRLQRSLVIPIQRKNVNDKIYVQNVIHVEMREASGGQKDRVVVVVVVVPLVLDES